MMLKSIKCKICNEEYSYIQQSEYEDHFSPHCFFHGHADEYIIVPKYIPAKQRIKYMKLKYPKNKIQIL